MNLTPDEHVTKKYKTYIEMENAVVEGDEY